MGIVYKLATTLSVSLLISCSFSSNTRYSSYDRPPSEAGKCYAKCVMPAMTVMDTLAVLPIYIGSDITNVGLSEYIVREAGMTTKWEKVKSEGCKGKPDDCYIWCLKEVPISKIAVSYVSDTTKTKEFKMEPITLPRDMEKGRTEWKEVLCQNDITKNTYQNIGLLLKDKGYLTEAELSKTKGRFNKTLKQALKNYQNDNLLPVGQLDLETLNDLGLSY